MKSKAVLAELLLARIALCMDDRTAARVHCQTALAQVSKTESPMLTYQAEFLMGEVEQTANEAEVAEPQVLPPGQRGARDVARQSARRGT